LFNARGSATTSKPQPSEALKQSSYSAAYRRGHACCM
jgi:hypothetical protein